MSKQRIIKDEIWDDEWFYDLTPTEKLVWMFLLTNTRSNIAGVYQFNKKWASNLLGITIEDLTGAMEAFVGAKKIQMCDGWVVINNFHKHQSKNPKVEAGVLRIIASLPKNILDLLPMDSLCIAYPTLLNLTLPKGGDKSPRKTKNNMSWKKPYNEDDHNDYTPSIDMETGELIKPAPKVKRMYKEVFALFDEVLGRHPANWLVNTTQQRCADNLYTERGLKAIKNALEFYKENKAKEFCPQITQPSDLDAKWTKLAEFKTKQHGPS